MAGLNSQAGVNKVAGINNTLAQPLVATKVSGNGNVTTIGTTFTGAKVAATKNNLGTTLNGGGNNSSNHIYPAANSGTAKATCNGRSGCEYSCVTPTTNQCKCTCSSEQTW